MDVVNNNLKNEVLQKRSNPATSIVIHSVPDTPGNNRLIHGNRTMI